VNPTSPAPALVGVLALQGAFLEHIRALESTGSRTRLVRTQADLEGLDGLIIPGGESTTMQILLERVGLLEPLRRAIEAGLPALGTCAGMILLAREITDGRPDQRGLGALDIAVRRNGYGRQVHSFEAAVRVEGLDGGFPGVFIRSLATRGQLGGLSRATVFALGIMLFQLLSGQLPYRGEDQLTIALAHLNEPLPDIRAINSTITAEMAEVVKRATMKDPNQRYTTAMEFAGAFTAALQMSGIATAGTSGSPALPARRKVGWHGTSDRDPRTYNR